CSVFILFSILLISCLQSLSALGSLTRMTTHRFSTRRCTRPKWTRMRISSTRSSLSPPRTTTSSTDGTVFVFFKANITKSRKNSYGLTGNQIRDLKN
ncbi:hypothetical protein L9F63_011703, partial [Diploptera punctata]